MLDVPDLLPCPALTLYHQLPDNNVDNGDGLGDDDDIDNDDDIDKDDDVDNDDDDDNGNDDDNGDDVICFPEPF